MAKPLFPLHLLAPLPARHWARHGPCDQAAIHIPLAPFVLHGERVDTSIRLDGIALDLGDLQAQARCSHRFPANPEEGCIDGSMYLQGRHVPVDITSLAFGTAEPCGIPLHIAGTMVFTVSGLGFWKDTPLELDILLEPAPTPAQIDAAIAVAVAAIGAQALRDAGKVMGQLTRQHPHWDDRKALHQAVSRYLAQQATSTTRP